MSDLITPSGMGASEESRKVVSGWNAIKNRGNAPTQTRQERLIKEQQERAEMIRKGIDPNKVESGFKPGSDNASGEFSMRDAKKFLNEKYQAQRAQKVFKNTPELCLIKIGYLLGTIQPDDGSKTESGKILKVEEAGFGQYKVTYIPE